MYKKTLKTDTDINLKGVPGKVDDETGFRGVFDEKWMMVEVKFLPHYY